MGAAVAMLVTPKTGRQMRDYLRDLIADEMESLRCKCHEAEHKAEEVKPQM